jgi:hypothetical protein
VTVVDVHTVTECGGVERVCHFCKPLRYKFFCFVDLSGVLFLSLLQLLQIVVGRYQCIDQGIDAGQKVFDDDLAVDHPPVDVSG